MSTRIDYPVAYYACYTLSELLNLHHTAPTTATQTAMLARVAQMDDYIDELRMRRELAERSLALASTENTRACEQAKALLEALDKVTEHANGLSSIVSGVAEHLEEAQDDLFGELD